MALRIITADQRLAEPAKINIALFGPSGVGKTFQARTLNPETTLFVDLEAGMLALQDWRGDTIDVRAMASDIGVTPWEFARAIACFLGGPDPSDNAGPYSKSAYAEYCKVLGEPAILKKYDTIFVDSITVASRHAFAWSKTQPQAFSEKTGKPDNRGAYGLLGQEMVTWLTQLQHIKSKSIIVVGILDREVDDLKRETFSPQIEGGKTGRELPGIFDQVVTLTNVVADDNGVKLAWPTEKHDKPVHRAFVCKTDNPFGVPAKDRSGRLDTLEPPDLGALIAKIRAGKRQDQQLVSTMPAQPAATVAPAAAA